MDGEGQMQRALRQASDLLRKPLEPAGRLARDLAQRGRGPAGELTGRGRELAESLRSVIRSEIRRQLRGMGLATREDIDRLDERLSAVEARAEAKSGRTRKALPAAGKSAAKRTAKASAGGGSPRAKSAPASASRPASEG